MEIKGFSPVILESERLVISEIDENDIPAIHEMNSYESVAAFNTIGIPLNLQATRKMFESLLMDQDHPRRSKYGWAIRLINCNTFIGEIGISLSAPKFKMAELYYSLLPPHWGHGYATEAVREVVKFTFNQLGLHRIEAGVDIRNTRSIRLLERIGMKREGLRRKMLPIGGQWHDTFLYAMLIEDL